MPNPRPSLATRAARVSVKETLGRAQHDRRTAEEYLADLAAETERSLRRNPERQPWTDSRYRKVERAGPGADGA